MSKLRALLDDDDDAPKPKKLARPVVKAQPAPTVALKPAGGRVRSLLDDEPSIEVNVQSVMPAHAAHSFAVCGLDSTLKKPKKEAPPELHKVAVPISGTSIVFCGDSPVLIICGANSTWSDLMVWNIAAMSLRHVLRADLEPKQAVDDTISELQKHIKIQSTSRK